MVIFFIFATLLAESRPQILHSFPQKLGTHAARFGKAGHGQRGEKERVKDKQVQNRQSLLMGKMCGEVVMEAKISSLVQDDVDPGPCIYFGGRGSSRGVVGELRRWGHVFELNKMVI